MADRLIDIHEDLLEIRKYLIKKGQSRYKCSVTQTKLKEAEILLNNSKSIFHILSSSKDKIENKLVADTYDKICQLFSEISNLCSLPSMDSKSGKMEFDLKSACSLIPILDGKEDTVKRLIDAVEIYAEMLNEGGQQFLIKFVLKGRLSETAKLRVATSYASVNDMLKDFRNKLLTKKSFTAIQNQIQSLNQGFRSIDDYGSQLEKLLMQLTISQADGNADTCAVLKPINEKMVIKKFADGLKNERLSTVIAARNYTSLQDAIQAAKDESLPSSSVPRTAEVMRMTSTFRGRGNNRFSKFRGQNNGYRNQYFNNNKQWHSQNNYKFNNYANRNQGHFRPSNYYPRDKVQYNRRGFNNNRRTPSHNQGFYNKNLYPVLSDKEKERVADRLQQKSNEVDSDQFFRS